MICTKCGKKCFAESGIRMGQSDYIAVSSCCKVPFDIDYSKDVFQKSNPESCWTRTCERGHIYEGRHHFDYCPECYKEIPEWAKKVMRMKIAGETICSGA